ncbi:MAG: hypothetical protein WKF58_09290 [Ilumatobacteraceae bacterium]
MSHVPPPHERPWRHPSELPAHPQEPVSTKARTVAIVGGTLGLVAIAMAALMVTPSREEVVAPSSSRFAGTGGDVHGAAGIERGGAREVRRHGTHRAALGDGASR